MRGGYYRDHAPPYTDADLRDEFADRYDIERAAMPAGTEWRARLIGVPGALLHTADSLGELARTLRMGQ